MRLDLPDGWAELWSPKHVKERKRRGYIAAMTDLNKAVGHSPKNDKGEPDPAYFGSAEMALADRVGDMLILALVREWSFGEVTLEVLEELPVDSFDPLFLACRDLAPELTPNYGPSPDPKSPYGRVVELAYALAGDGAVDIRDPDFRRYVLTFEAHMPPTVQDEQPAVVLDELLVVHGRVNERLAEKQEAASAVR